MSFLRTVSRATKSATCAIALTFLAASTADAQMQITTVITDDFADGFSDTVGDGTQLNFFTTSSTMGLNTDPTVAGPLEFATGSSSRAIHGLFAPQTLVAVGDSVEVTFDFTTPASVNSNGTTQNEDFRWALFSTANAPNGQADFAMNIESSSNPDTGAGPNMILEDLPGVVGEVDNINRAGTDLGLRTHNSDGLEMQSNAAPATGRLLTTTTGFDFISGGVDDEITLVGSTDYTGRLRIELNDATGETLDVTVELLDAAGVVISTHTDDLLVEDMLDVDTDGDFVPDGGEIGVKTMSFDMFALSATGDAFGTNNVIGDADNGISISNVTITSVITDPNAGCLLADVNMNTVVDFNDIPDFVNVLLMGPFQCEADCDENGVVDFNDIPFFVDILLNP